MTVAAIDIEIYCNNCGRGLCNITYFTETRGRGYPGFRVSPCPDCVEEAKNEGDEAGYERGLQDGRNEKG